MLNFLFTIREGFKGFRRARLSTFISISSIVFSLFLITIFLVISLNISNWIGELRSKLELEVFLDRTLEDTEAQKIQKSIKKIVQVENTKYISKEEAAKRFEQEFGRNVYELLQSNPLPASIVVTLKQDHQNALGAAAVTKEIQKLSGIDEVIYQKELIGLIDHYLSIVFISGAVIIILLVTITFILLYNTIRLTIFARRDIIEIMKLVGAKKSFIRRPFVVEGLLQGFIGSVLASGLVYVSIKIIVKFVYPFLVFKNEIYGILIFMGLLIGFLSSRISVQKHLESL